MASFQKCERLSIVIAGHSRLKDGVALLAYDPAISIGGALCLDNRDGRVKPGHDG
jgi:hypothetical protein